MSPYTDHRRLVGRIRELAEALAAEADHFHRLAAKRRHPRRIASTINRSTQWSQHAFRALVMSIVALREAQDQLQKPHTLRRQK